MRRGAVPFVVIAATALVALLVYGVLAVGESTTLDDAVSRGETPPAPVRELPMLDGKTGSLADFKGKPVVLNFWASWCEPCEAEAPVLKKAQAKLKAAGGTILGVTVDDASGDSRKFLKKHGLSFPSLRDVNGDLKKDYGGTGVPETFVIDRNGNVVAMSRGQIDADFMDRALTKVLP
ncbi:MAG TPA: TlpA disulfide reductase family protein [Solirubrobacteraceae bacterium]|nr:TlpA disulfide reductase family protein [Solirubrobacteraceae bacterium]